MLLSASRLFWQRFVLVACAIFLSKRDKPIFGAILLPAILVIFYVATRTSTSAYPIAKITLTILPFVIGLVFVALSRIAPINPGHAVGALMKLFCAGTVAGAAARSVGYYSEVLKNEGLLRYVRELHFLNVCRELAEIKEKRVLLFENDPLLSRWLWYYARNNGVYFDGRLISDSFAPPLAPFARVPDLANVDFVANPDRIVDLRATNVSCLTPVDDMQLSVKAKGTIRTQGPPFRSLRRWMTSNSARSI